MHDLSLLNYQTKSVECKLNLCIYEYFEICNKYSNIKNLFLRKSEDYFVLGTKNCVNETEIE